MQCPFCGQDHDKVVDSRSSEGGRTIRRRRECLECGRRFTTYERPEGSVRLTVMKKDGSREPYDREKVIAGIQRACYKRPVTDEQIRYIVDTAEEEIFRNFDKTVPSSFISDCLGRTLQHVDKIAYVRFASVYRDFADVGELISEAQQARDVPQFGPGQGSLFEPPVEKRNNSPKT